MKKSLLLLLSAGFASLTMLSFSSGIAEGPYFYNRTGAGGSQNDCTGSGCHDPNTNDLNISIILTDLGTGDTVRNGRYTPNGIYGVKLFARTLTPGYRKFGFQFTAALSNGRAAGNYIPTSGLQANPVGQYEIVEHTNQIPATGNAFVTTIYWKAPTFGMGNVTFFTTMLASNDNGFANGDLTNAEQSTFGVNPTSAGSISDDVITKVYPNPASDQFQLSMEHAERGTYSLITYSAHAQIVDQRTITVTGTESQVLFNSSAWAPGNYFIQIVKDGERRIIPFVKR